MNKISQSICPTPLILAVLLQESLLQVDLVLAPLRPAFLTQIFPVEQTNRAKEFVTPDKVAITEEILSNTRDSASVL